MKDLNNMMQDKDNLNNNANAQDDLFKGYTLEELRYQRALMSLRSDFCKEKLMAEVGNITQNSPLTKFKRNRTGIVGKLAKSLDFIDYAMLGLTMFKTIKSIISIFKK